MNKKVVFFSPHASILLHSIPEALIAEALESRGYTVIIVGCKSILSQRCTTFDCNGVRGSITLDKQREICGKCINAQEKVDSHFKFSRIYLDDFITEEDVGFIDQKIASSSISDLLDFQPYGIPIGSLATYEVCLIFKKLDHYFKNIEVQEYLSYLRGCYLALKAFDRIFDQLDPLFLFTYNSLYSANRTVSLLAEVKGIRAYSLHAGNNLLKRYTTLTISKHNQVEHLRYLISVWPKFSTIPCSEGTAKSITDHQLEIFKGKDAWAYSSPVSHLNSIRQYFSIPDNAKLLIATMSSYDERFAAESIGSLDTPVNLLFPKQVDWIRWLFSYVASRHDLFLIVRVHPREFPNKREAMLSSHAQLLAKVFESKPANVAINWPTDNISLYDLAKEVDVVLNSWSSVGKELSMLGIPVVIYSSELVGYPSELNLLGDSEQSYSEAIEYALSSGFNFENIRKTYRWLALEQAYSSIDISDSFTPPQISSDLLKKLIRRFIRTINRDYQLITSMQTSLKEHLSPLLESNSIDKMVESECNSIVDVRYGNSISSASEVEETQLLIGQVKRLYDALLTEKSKGTYLQKILAYENKQQQLGHNQLSTPSAP